MFLDLFGCKLWAEHDTDLLFVPAEMQQTFTRCMDHSYCLCSYRALVLRSVLLLKDGLRADQPVAHWAIHWEAVWCWQMGKNHSLLKENEQSKKEHALIRPFVCCDRFRGKFSFLLTLNCYHQKATRKQGSAFAFMSFFCALKKISQDTFVIKECGTEADTDYLYKLRYSGSLKWECTFNFNTFFLMLWCSASRHH